jgi:hypothetical protein
MKPAPYPTYGTPTLDQTKEYNPVGHLLGGGMMGQDKFGYSFAATTSGYGQIPSLPPLERHQSWPNPAPTAITSLLNEDTRHRPGEYATPRYH